MEVPIKLLFDGETVANINSFFYETPWATGKVEFSDQTFHSKLIRITSFKNYDFELEELNLEEEEEEKLWKAKLLELNINTSDFAILEDERWSILTKDGNILNIYTMKFDEEGYMDWRL